MSPQGRMTDEQVEAVRRYRPLDALIPTHWTEGQVVASGMRQRYYRTGGSGSGKPALVLLHGIMAGGITWLRVARGWRRSTTW